MLESPPPGLDVSALPGVMWDPRVAIHRAPAHRHREIRRMLEHRNITFDDEVAASGEPVHRWSVPDLRDYQQAALTAWEMSSRRGLVALPTGSGKTRLALAAMASSGLRALCLVPTRVLLDQWCGEVARVYAGPVGRLGDGTRLLAAVTVATFESAYRHMAWLGNRFGLLVVDEAHHFGKGARDEALEMSTAPARLGLTATPPRDEPARQRLTELVGPTVLELSIGDLSGRWLCELQIVTLHVDLTPEERVKYDVWVAAFGEAYRAFRRVAPQATWRDFCAAAARTAAGRRALQAYRSSRRLVAFPSAKRRLIGALLARHRGRRTLVFTADNDTAYAVAREHLIMPITCDIDRKEREAALARFREGELGALVSARVLNEGIDVPGADVGIVVGATLGEREHVQRVGRLLRPADGKRALVYELVVRGTFEVRQAARRRAGLGARAADLV